MIKLKNILSEAYAWERTPGKALPTMKDVQEAYDAKGVEDAADEANEAAKPDYIDLDKDGDKDETMKKAAADLDSKDSKVVKEEDDDYDNDHSDPLIDEEETDHAADEAEEDLDVLNMGSLEEGFWGRVRGNLHGHEYILREAFRK
jgi:hypothetical protein